MKLILKLATSILSLLIVSYLIPGFDIEGIWAALVATVIIGIINTFVKPVLKIITFPITIVTFGISAFLTNVLLLLLASKIVPGFNIDNFLSAAISSILLTLTSWFLNKLAF